MKNSFFYQKIVACRGIWQIGLVVVLLLPSNLVAQDFPKPMSPPRLVNDFVGMLNNTERETLEQKLRAYNDSTSTQITVVVVKSTQPYPASDYAFELGRRWGVGQKGKNNGLVLLWATDDRKIFIATGYGMEGAIPDAIAKRIISTIIGPAFKNQMYYQGLDKGTDEIIRRASGEYKADPHNNGEFPIEFLIFAVVFFVVLFIIFKNRGNGGGGRRYHDRGPDVFWFPYVTHSGGGSSSGSWGDSGGGGFDFGGFGGGDFGGGGAGGDY